MGHHPSASYWRAATVLTANVSEGSSSRLWEQCKSNCSDRVDTTIAPLDGKLCLPLQLLSGWLHGNATICSDSQEYALTFWLVLQLVIECDIPIDSVWSLSSAGHPQWCCSIGKVLHLWSSMALVVICEQRSQGQKKVKGQKKRVKTSDENRYCRQEVFFKTHDCGEQWMKCNSGEVFRSESAVAFLPRCWGGLSINGK